MPTAKKTYFLNSDKSKLVDEGSAEAHYLLAREGAYVSPEDAKKYKLSVEDDPVELAEVVDETTEAETAEPEEVKSSSKAKKSKK